MIGVGIDPHEQTHTAVALDAVTGGKVAELTVRARTRGSEQLLAWARELDDVERFAEEDGPPRLGIAGAVPDRRSPPKARPRSSGGRAEGDMRGHIDWSQVAAVTWRAPKGDPSGDALR